MNQPRDAPSLKANPQPAAMELGEGMHGVSPTLAARPPWGGWWWWFMPSGFPVIHNLIRSGLALTPPPAEPSPAQMVTRTC